MYKGSRQNPPKDKSQGGLKVIQKDEDDTGIENTGSSETNSCETDTYDENSSTSLPDSIEGAVQSYRRDKGEIVINFLFVGPYSI